MATKEQVKFQQIDIGSLSAEQHTAFIAYLRAKSAFRAALQSSAPTGHKLVFTEKYGTAEKPEDAVLKVALVKAGSAKSAAPRLGLADFLEAQDAAGFAR